MSSLFLIPSSLFKHTFQSLNPFDLKSYFLISGCSVRVFPAGGHQAWLPLAAQWAEDALQVSGIFGEKRVKNCFEKEGIQKCTIFDVSLVQGPLEEKNTFFFRVLINLTSLFSGRIGRENILFCTRYEETSFTILAFTSAIFIT